MTYRPYTTAESAYVRLQAQGFAPQVVYDIGANIGDWTQEIRTLWPDARYFLFEGSSEPYFQLKQRGEEAYPWVLGDELGKEVTFYVGSQYSTGNSILPELTTHTFNATKRETYTLDWAHERVGVPLPDLMKLDTQGSELLILKGAKRALEHVSVIQLETSLHCYNEGAPLIAESLAFMQELGFYAFDVVSANRYRDTLSQMDFLFCRKESPFLKKGFRE